MPSRTPTALGGHALDCAAARSARLKRSKGPPCDRISGRIFRPIGVRVVRTRRARNESTRQTALPGRPSMLNGTYRYRDHIAPFVVGGTLSIAISAPECAAPTTRTGPSRRLSGFLYSLE